MAATAQSSTSPWEAASLKPESDHSYLWRRLHSLSGLLPVGAFLLFHIYENTGAITGPEHYNEGIGKLAQLLPPPYFYLLEIFVLMVPILFHGLYGAYVALEGKSNVGLYPFRRNYMYLLQRLSGVVALVFITYHVVTLRVMVTMLKTGSGLPGLPGYVTFADVARNFANDWVFGLIYVPGVICSAFHLGNGLNGFCWTWGITVGERSRRVVEWLGWIVFLATAIPMLHILWTFRH